MAFQTDDLMVVNRAGTDYKAKISELLAVAEGQVNDGKLTIKESQGTDGGDAQEYEFTANQELDSQVVIGNGCFQLVDHEGNLLGDFFANQTQNEIFRLPAPPTVGAGDITIEAGDGLLSSGDASHNANQQDDSTQVLSVNTGAGLEINANGEVVIKPGAGIEIDLDGNIVIDPTFDLSNNVSLALGDLTDVSDADANAGEVLYKKEDGSYGFTDIAELPSHDHSQYALLEGRPRPNDGDPDGQEIGTGQIWARRNNHGGTNASDLSKDAAGVFESSWNGLGTPPHMCHAFLASYRYGIYIDSSTPWSNRLHNLHITSDHSQNDGKTGLKVGNEISMNMQDDEGVGMIKAKGFIGDGSRLDGVMPLDLRTLPPL